MLHLIGKNLWARRYRNGWLLAELIIVSMVIWVLTDPIVVTTHDRGLPTGITEEGMYRLNLAAVSSKSARFEAGGRHSGGTCCQCTTDSFAHSRL